MLRLGIVPLMTTSLKNCRHQLGYVREALRTTSQFLSVHPTLPHSTMETLYPVLIDWLYHKDASVVAEAFHALGSAVAVQCDDHPVLFSPGVFSALGRDLSDENLDVEALTPAVRLAANMCSACDSVVDKFIAAECLDPFVRHLDNSDTTILKDTVWGISNIAGGTGNQIDTTMKIGCMPKVIRLVSTNGRSDIVTEALWVLSNACHRPKAAKQLVRLGVVDAFQFGLGLRDSKQVRIALVGLKMLLNCDQTLLLPPKTTLSDALKALFSDPLNHNDAKEIYRRLEGDPA